MTTHDSKNPNCLELCEVGPRDGLQNESILVPLETKVAFIDALSESGLKEIEVGSFVRPDIIPQLADSAEVLSRIKRRDGVCYSALVPNRRGLDGALAASVDKVSIFTAASESFAGHNIKATIAESIERFMPVVDGAHQAGIPVRGYVSCVVACPYEGAIAPSAVVDVCRRLLAIGVDELDLGETLGVSHPEEIDALLEAVGEIESLDRIVLHLHDTKGRAVSCARRAWDLGIRRFDGSCRGLGGCPFAPGAAGNVATESLVSLFDEMGHPSGVSLEKLHEAARLLDMLL
jgi:hydroxymethylglutaryl-CoA lyase